MNRSISRSQKNNFSEQKHESGQVLVVQLLWETPNSCSSSWIAHRLFIGTLVSLCLLVTYQWVKAKLGINC